MRYTEGRTFWGDPTHPSEGCLKRQKGQPMRAIISVANREGLAELARELQNHGVSLFTTSGTLAALKAASVAAESVTTLTQFPEILGGRVKTLHPAILGGILARRDLPEHSQE